MSTCTLLVEFLFALTTVSVGGYLLTVLIGRVGASLRFTAALLGLIVALAADSPELSSSISALLHGRHDVGRGVILGSNIRHQCIHAEVLTALRPLANEAKFEC